jgi:YidC/Oxa1 family membrane protein insertase
MDAILQPLYTVFGFIVKFLFDFVGNYGIAVILFTILLRAALIPLGLNQFKNTIKQQGMAEEQKDIQRRYANDKEKLQQAQMELYQKHGFSPFSGCLPSILQLIIIWPVYRIISAPLIHVMGVAKDAIGSVAFDKAGAVTASSGIAKILYDLHLITNTQATQAQMFNLPLVDALKNSTEALGQAVSQGLMKASQLLDLTFLGMNLGKVPTYQPATLFGPEMGTWLPLMAIPILAVITTWLSMRITQSMMPGAKSAKQKKEEAERAKKNPAKKGQEGPDPSAGMMKGMQYFLPLFTLWISFTTPAALGLYWIINNVMSIVQQYVLYNTVGKKTPVPVAPSATDASNKTPAVKG